MSILVHEEDFLIVKTSYWIQGGPNIILVEMSDGLLLLHGNGEFVVGRKMVEDKGSWNLNI